MNRYIAFLKVFERNSFSDAARDLGYTQSAVSQMIKSLEEELGVTLLVRSRSGVALTYEGRHLLPYIRDTVNAYRMLQSQAAGFSGLEQGTIRLGTFTSVSSFLLPPAMERFRNQHSGIRFELYQGLYYEIEDWEREGVVAFGFGTAGGVLLAKLMNVLSGGKINPLIGSAGVSAVPMAARVSQTVGAKENPTNFLLMHAMGPNVAGVIGSAVAAGFFMLIFG